MKKNTFLFLFLLLLILPKANAQIANPLAGYAYQFRLTLTDKGKSGYSIEKPLEFLSPKAMERRVKQNIPITQSDLPIAKSYIKAVEKTGVTVIARSKWLNTITVHCTDSLQVVALNKLPFVKSSQLVWRGENKTDREKGLDQSIYSTQADVLFGVPYGLAIDNIKPHNGNLLHAVGFKGKGMTVAVIDAGFNHLDRIEILNNVDIKGHKGFVYGNDDLYDNDNEHGLNVLSCMATNRYNQFVGTAPEASYWLLGSEDSRSEYPVEEDYWATAIEYADSVGVDVVNTSLGYTKYDAPTQSYTHAILDGKTAFITQAADMAFSKGMVVVCAAGNEGNSSWRKISVPSDGMNVLAVGAIQRDSVVVGFSSRGLSADLRIKPDVMALGLNAFVVGDNGKIRNSSGTSFASPIMCGIVTCLWQANPTLTNYELLDILRQSSNNYEKPNGDYGYGIPNMEKALVLGTQLAEQKEKQLLIEKKLKERYKDVRLEEPKKKTSKAKATKK